MPKIFTMEVKSNDEYYAKLYDSTSELYLKIVEAEEDMENEDD